MYINKINDNNILDRSQIMKENNNKKFKLTTLSLILVIA